MIHNVELVKIRVPVSCRHRQVLLCFVLCHSHCVKRCLYGFPAFGWCFSGLQFVAKSCSDSFSSLVVVVVAVVLSCFFSILPSRFLVPDLCSSELMIVCTGYGVKSCLVEFCFLQSFRVYFLFWVLHLQLLCARLLLSVFKKSLFFKA